MKTEAALSALGGLAQETRLGIFRLLVEVGHDGLLAGELAARLSIPSTTLSFHLKNLSQAALITPSKVGTTIRYTANFDAMNDLVGYLTANCCGGDLSACLPKAKTPRRPTRTR